MASPPPRIVDPANVSSIVNKIMERHQLRVQDIKNMKKAIVVVHGKGQYDCPECPYSWLSYFSWIRIDLREQVIDYRWRMKCKNCLMMYKPTFSLEETEKLVEKAVYAYKGEYYVNPDGERRIRSEFRPPHLPALCEKCGWGQVQCWTLPPYSCFIK